MTFVRFSYFRWSVAVHVCVRKCAVACAWMCVPLSRCVCVPGSISIGGMSKMLLWPGQAAGAHKADHQREPRLWVLACVAAGRLTLLPSGSQPKMAINWPTICPLVSGQRNLVFSGAVSFSEKLPLSLSLSVSLSLSGCLSLVLSFSCLILWSIFYDWGIILLRD